MKAKLAILFITIISINSNPFVRKLAVTEESCKKAGKDYKEAQPAQCKTGNTIFEVSKESDCKKGTWTGKEDGVCSGTASPALTKNNCKGTPYYEVKEVTKSQSICKVGEEVIQQGATQEGCENSVQWTNKKCNVDGIDVSSCTYAKPAWLAECKINENVSFGYRM